MFDIGFSEVLLIFVIALIVLGPEKLPRVAAQVGRWVGRARAMARQFRDQLEEEVNLEQVRKAHEAKPQNPAEPPPQATPPQTQTEGRTDGADHGQNALGQSSGPSDAMQGQAFQTSQPQQVGEAAPFTGPDPVDFRADTFANAQPSDTFSHAHPTNEYGANPLTLNGAPEPPPPQPPEITPPSAAESGLAGAQAEDPIHGAQRAAVSGEAYASSTQPTAPPPADKSGTA